MTARSTVTLYLRVAPEIKARAQREAGRCGIDVSEFVSALVRGEELEPRPAIELTEIVLAGRALVQAANRLVERIAAGEALEPLRDEVAALRQRIAAFIADHRWRYDALLDHGALKDDWSGRR